MIQAAPRIIQAAPRVTSPGLRHSGEMSVSVMRERLIVAGPRRRGLLCGAAQLLAAVRITIVVAALAAAERLRLGVVLLDIQLPGIDGLEVAARLAATPCPPQVVLVSTRDVSSYRRRLATSPVRGFLSKSELSGSALGALVS
jgi:CheY-like chemotaxis protein